MGSFPFQIQRDWLREPGSYFQPDVGRVAQEESWLEGCRRHLRPDHAQERAPHGRTHLDPQLPTRAPLA